jgi:hypothetical protein
VIAWVVSAWLVIEPPPSPAESAGELEATAPSEPAPSEPTSEPEPEPEPEQPVAEGPQPAKPSGPPWYTQDDIDHLRARYGIAPDVQLEPRKPKWRCLIPDPSCGFGFELSATTAYAYRARQGNIAVEGSFYDWHSARIAYDVWINLPAYTQTIGSHKYTRLTMGPKLAVVASDNADLWGNFGVALRYWFGTRKWSPALEFSSALSFKLASEDPDFPITTRRSPVGVTADIGINVGGWGAIILGGQYDSPLAREEIPEKFRVSAAGQVFVGFRGNILWGAPAVAAVATHVGVLRRLPDQP